MSNAGQGALHTHLRVWSHLCQLAQRRMRLREVRELAQDLTACKWCIRGSNPGLSGSHTGLQRKNLDLFEIFFFFWSRKVVHSKTPSFWVGNYAKHVPLPPLAWRLSRERSIWGLYAPVICLLGLKLTTRCLYIFFYRGHFLRLK